MNSRAARMGSRLPHNGDGTPRTPRGRARALGLGSSALAHIAMGVFLIGSASGELVSSGAAGGGPEGPVFAVELVSASELGGAPSVATSQFEPLFAKYDVTVSDAVPVQSGQTSGFSRLAAKLTRPSDNAEDGREGASASGSPHPAPRPLQDRDTSRQGAATEGGSTNDASTGALWGRISPCWRRIRGAASVPVSLEIKLDARGQLEAPPKILRTRSVTIDEARLKAEAAAVAALAKCLPKNDRSFSGQTHRLDFRD